MNYLKELKYSLESYRTTWEELTIYSKAFRSGFKLRHDEFFYNPQTDERNTELEGLLRSERERHSVKLKQLGCEDRHNIAETLAIYSFLCHPLDFYRVVGASWRMAHDAGMP